MTPRQLRRWTAAALATLFLGPPGGVPVGRARAAPPAGSPNLLELVAQPFDTQKQTPRIPAHLTAGSQREASLHLIQFRQPITETNLELVRGSGVELVGYLPQNAYLVWADVPANIALDGFVARQEILQFSRTLDPYFKLAPDLLEAAVSYTRSDEEIDINVLVYRHAGAAGTSDWLASRSRQSTQVSASGKSDLHIQARLSRDELIALAHRGDVIWIEPMVEGELFDEVQTQVVAGNLNGAQTGPSGPGYLAWLQGRGFSTNPTDYPVIDLIDTGVGNGTTSPGDATLHQLGSLANPSRLMYNLNCHTGGDGGDVRGHGHINASVVIGYDNRIGFPFQDGDGYRLGLGVNPFARLGSTQVYSPTSGPSTSGCGGDSAMLAAIYNAGARIANASWGDLVNGLYNGRARSFDIAVRDADSSTPGHQPLALVAAVGNRGNSPGNVAPPATAKNVLSVGAAESFRPGFTDPCMVPGNLADNIMDLASFSSRGPAAGERVKPELVAPGTHIQGTASTDLDFNNALPCGGSGGNSVGVYPPGQTTFTITDGTSQAAPAVAGAMSLAYRWLATQYGFTAPSPALLKAYLIAHTTYLTGAEAGDTLPSNNQGFGMPNLARAFESIPRQLIDQSVLLDASGQSHTVNVNVADLTKPVRIVLVYTDAPGLTIGNPQVNNLDLTVTSGVNLYHGNRFSGAWSITGGAADPNNNSEAVFLSQGISGTLQVTVSATAINGDGVPEVGDTTDQDFALVCYNCAAIDLTDVWVDFNYTGPEAGTISLPYNTLAEGVAALSTGGVLHIKPGTSLEQPTINKAMILQAEGGLVRVGG